MLEPAPAPSWTRTWCPAAVSSRAPSGVSATRYSLSLTSLGTPTITAWPFHVRDAGSVPDPATVPASSGRLDRVHQPGAGNAPELVLPAFGEDDARARDQVCHRAGDQDLVRGRERRDARADVDRDAPQISVRDLDLAGVDPGPDLHPDSTDRLDRRDRATDRPGRSVEGREEPVAGRVHLPSAPAIELASD